jgi:hypothetical protein
VTRDDVVDKIVAEAKRRLIFVIAQRVLTPLGINLRLSIERSGLAHVKTVEQLFVAIDEAATAEAQKADTAFHKDKLSALVLAESIRCQSAIDDRNVGELLLIFEGKQLMNVVCGLAGCPNPAGMLRAVVKHLKPSDFTRLSDLGQALAAAFPTPVRP